MFYLNDNQKKFNLIFQSVFLAFFVLSLFGSFAQPARADAACDAFQSQFNITTPQGKEKNITEGLPKICSAQQLLLMAINIGMTFAGGIAVLFIMVGGYWYMTSAGNEEQAEKGKKTLINSIIGLVVIIMAVVIVRVIAQTLQAGAGG